MTAFLILLGSPTEQTAVLSYIPISFWPLGRNSNTLMHISFLMLRIPGHKIWSHAFSHENLHCSRGIQVPLVPVLRMMMMMYRYQRMGLTHWSSCCLTFANLGEVVEDTFFSLLKICIHMGWLDSKLTASEVTSPSQRK